MHRQLHQLLQTLTPIPDVELRKAENIFQPVQLAKGDFFVRAGDVPQTLGFVLVGLLRLYYIDDNGNEWTKSFCAANSFVAAYSALLLGEPSRLFIETLEDSTLLVAPHHTFQSLCQEHPCWQAVNRQLAEALFIKKEKREATLLLDDAPTRYLNFLADYSDLEPRLKQYHIASYLGITPEALSRIRANLKTKN